MWRRVGSFAWKNADALILILIAAGVLVFDALGGTPSQSVLVSLNLAILGGIAFMFLRDRRDMAGLSHLEELVRAQQQDRPFEVQSESIVWTLNSTDDQPDHAVYENTQTLKFIRGKASVLEHWSTSSTGKHTIKDCSGSYRTPGAEPWIGASLIHDFPIRGGTNYLFCVDKEYSKGEQLEWRVRRDMVDRFPTSRESVKASSVVDPGIKRHLKVVWPLSRPPADVKLHVDGQAPRDLKIWKDGIGRCVAEERVLAEPGAEGPIISWSWEKLTT
jgi:hypothetical protein